MNRHNRRINVVCQFVRYAYYDDSSDDAVGVLLKIDNYAENTVPYLSDKQFQRHFRMSPTTFEDLLQKLNVVREEHHSGGYPRMLLEKEAMITIWYLGNLESFRSVSERFGISKSSCWEVLYRTCHELLKINRRYKIICWPLQDRQMEISHHFENAKRFPGITGCIDGSHIKITAPKDHPNSYINRKSYHSVLLQGVCDHRMLFTDVYAGEAGSIHDYTLYRKSDLYSGIRNGELIFHNNTHLIGDLAYKLGPTLIVGFKNYGNLTQRQQNFNRKLNKARVVIENSFLLLKGRFRRLKLVETVRLDLIALLIVSSCILHNIGILTGDLLEDIVHLEAELQEEREQNLHNMRDMDVEAETRAAQRKRQNILNTLPMGE